MATIIFIQIYKYTNIQIYKYTKIQIYKYTNIQMYKYTNIQKYKYTNTQIYNILASEAAPPDCEDKQTQLLLDFGNSSIANNSIQNFELRCKKVKDQHL